MNTLKHLADSLRPSCRKKLAATFSIIYTMRSKLIQVAVVIIAATALTTPAMAATSVLGSDGQKLSASITKVRSGQEITVSGQGFDETVGIYLAYCLMPKKERRLPHVVAELIKKESEMLPTGSHPMRLPMPPD